MGVVAHADQWLYSIGGRDADGKATADVWRARVQADGSLDAWQAQPALPVRLNLHVVVALNGYVYAIGGYDNQNYHSEVWRSQIAADGSLSAWQRDRDYPLAITLHAATAASGRIYVSGGYTPQRGTNHVYFTTQNADGTLGPWQATASLPVSNLYRHAMAATDTTLYVIGGYDGSNVRREVHAAHINHDGTLGPWQTSNLPSPREYLGAVIHDGRLLVLGGRDHRDSPGLTHVEAAFINSDGSLGAWTSEPALPEPLYRLGAVTVHRHGSNSVYVLGGLSDDQNRATVYRFDFPPTPTPTPTLTPISTPTSLVPSALTLYPITPPEANPTYTVSWSAVTGATSYVLERATGAGFSDAVQVYAGPATQHVEASAGIATYHYRVKARNAWGDSGWSNVRTVAVRWELEPNGEAVDATLTGPLRPGLTYYGVLTGADPKKNDYFYFDLAETRTVELWLTNMAPSHDLNLVLRDYQLNMVPGGYSGNVGNADEYIRSPSLAPGRYYVQVRWVAGDSTQPYHLRGVW